MFTALMPMKGNSVRLPNKNIAQFGGEPLCLAMLRKLANCQWIDQILINTDSEEIADVVLSEKISHVEVVKREEKLLGDEIVMNQLIESDLHKCKNEYILQTHCTNPLLTIDSLARARQAFCSQSERYDSLLAVTKYCGRFYDENFVEINHSRNQLEMTQKVKPIYEDNSCIYMFTKKSFGVNKSRIGINPYFFELNKLESVDIDTFEDFKIAECIYQSFFC